MEETLKLSDIKIYILVPEILLPLMSEFTERFDYYWGEPFQIIITYTPLEEWSTSLIDFLNSIEDEYLILLHEDFYLTAPVKHEILERLIEHIRRTDADRVSLLGNHTPDRANCEGDLCIHNADADYQFSFESSIYKRTWLLKHLIKHQSPWDVEIEGRKKIKGRVIASPEPIIFYKDKIRKGVINEF